MGSGDRHSVSVQASSCSSVLTGGKVRMMEGGIGRGKDDL